MAICAAAARDSGWVCEELGRLALSEVRATCERHHAHAIGPEEMIDQKPHARGALAVAGSWAALPALALDAWEPAYGRLAEAQVKWESAHGRPLPTSGA